MCLGMISSPLASNNDIQNLSSFNAEEIMKVFGLTRDFQLGEGGSVANCKLCYFTERVLIGEATLVHGRIKDL